MPVVLKIKSEIDSHSFMRDPHHILGIHPLSTFSKVIRLWRPGASQIYFELFGKIVEAKRVSNQGLFELEVPLKTALSDYRVYSERGELHHDPYAFLPTFGDVDAYLFGKGVHYELYNALGGHPCIHQGVEGVKFAVWAPNALGVSLVGDFNLWNGAAHPMRLMGGSGVWELFLPGLKEGEKYKFEVRSKEDRVFIKTDPYGNYSELRPSTASIVFDVDRYNWSDQSWMQARALSHRDAYPMTIYEVHLGSWKRRSGKGQEGEFLNYRELAIELAAYCKKMGFSHVELLPVCEHPLDESWGYQVTGFFAATSRYGTPEDFQFFVDHMHQEGIGVLLDWVPAHFPMDEFSLTQFDGTCLYEHSDPRQGFHPHWSTSIFNYGRHEVSNFLIASALFWLDKMHVDGLRVDAVASMLYRDYGRREGQWIPNIYGGNFNLEAIEFLKHLNATIAERFPHVHRIAEESTAFTGVTHSLAFGGLGFTLKWNMGWMNDSLRYFQKDPIYRNYHQNDLTFALLYAFSERFILPLSHDEVVHGKGALLSKMPGDDWQKFANLRLLYSYQLCQPGKKLLFMGAEIGQWEEWGTHRLVSWGLLQYERHQQLHHFFGEANHFYKAHSPLWEMDFDYRGFEWVDFSDTENVVISYLRKGANRFILVVHHFTPNFIPNYFIKLPNVRTIREVFNSDREEYGGSGKINSSVQIICDDKEKRIGVQAMLSPLATICFEVEFVF